MVLKSQQMRLICFVIYSQKQFFFITVMMKMRGMMRMDK